MQIVLYAATMGSLAQQVADFPHYGRNTPPRTRTGCLCDPRTIRARKPLPRLLLPQADGGLPRQTGHGAGLLGGGAPGDRSGYLQITTALEVNARAENVPGTAFERPFGYNAAKMPCYE